MKQILGLCCILFSISTFGQSNEYEILNDENEQTAFIEYFKKSYEDLTLTISKNYEKKFNKALKERYTKFTDDFIDNIKDNQFMFDPRFGSLAQEILDEIKAKNPQVPSDLKILISKSTSLNGYCLPNGTLVLHMGVFYWLENEDQIAAIVAHEIGHKIMEHGLKTSLKAIEDNLSDKNKNMVKTLSKEKHQRADRALELFKSQLYATGDLRKKHEYEADSVSYMLLKNTKYNISELTSTMRLAVMYDSLKPVGLKEEVYKEMFNLPQLPFNEDWLKNEDFSRYNYDLYKSKFDSEALASHPDMELRIAKLEQNFPELKNQKTVEITENFKKLERLAEMNMVPNLMDQEQYGHAIYLCLLRLQNKKDVDFHKSWLGKAFEKVYEARKNYTLNRYLDRIDPAAHSESYIQFLSFMWNLKVDEIKAIATHYQS